jgi:hypothetical protein
MLQKSADNSMMVPFGGRSLFQKGPDFRVSQEFKAKHLQMGL